MNEAETRAIRFAYSTNGQGFYGIDMQEGTEGVVPKFPTPDELWNTTFPSTGSGADAWRDRFAAVPFEDKSGYFQPRYYQDIAIDRVLEATAAGAIRRVARRVCAAIVAKSC